MESERATTIIDLAATLATRAEEFDEVLILARKKSGEGYSNDTGLTIRDAVYLCETFKHWVLSHSADA